MGIGFFLEVECLARLIPQRLDSLALAQVISSLKPGGRSYRSSVNQELQELRSCRMGD
jgi:hypothetical protein